MDRRTDIQIVWPGKERTQEESTWLTFPVNGFVLSVPHTAPDICFQPWLKALQMVWKADMTNAPEDLRLGGWREKEERVAGRMMGWRCKTREHGM